MSSQRRSSSIGNTRSVPHTNSITRRTSVNRMEPLSNPRMLPQPALVPTVHSAPRVNSITRRTSVNRMDPISNPRMPQPMLGPTVPSVQATAAATHTPPPRKPSFTKRNVLPPPSNRPHTASKWRQMLPSADDIKCPLGHYTIFVTNNAYGSSALTTCDICERNLSGTWNRGVYHCHLDDCPAHDGGVHFHGWDMCVDCAVRRAIHGAWMKSLEPTKRKTKQKAQNLKQVKRESSQFCEDNSMEHREDSMVTDDCPETPSSCILRLPYDCIVHMMFFLDKEDRGKILLTSRNMFSFVGESWGCLLRNTPCATCKEHILTDSYETSESVFPECASCGACYHLQCVPSDTMKCESCAFPVKPGSQVSYRRLRIGCSDHMYPLPPPIDGFQISGSGRADGVYSVGPYPSDGVPMYLWYPTPLDLKMGRHICALYRMMGQWRIAELSPICCTEDELFFLMDEGVSLEAGLDGKQKWNASLKLRGHHEKSLKVERCTK